MTLRFAWERFSDIALEIATLTVRNQAEIGGDYEPYDPDWRLYFARDEAGSLRIWTARSGDVLVGYIVWFVSHGKHCRGTLFAESDLAYLIPELRKGWEGVRFLREGIDAVKALPGVNIVRFTTNDLYENGRLGNVLEHIGMQRVGSVYRLGDVKDGRVT